MNLETSRPLRISTLKQEGALNVSKWIKCPVLLDTSEMQALLQELTPLYFCPVSEPVRSDEAIIHPHQFLEQYQAYVEALKAGILIDELPLRRYFSSIMTSDTDLVYAIAVPQDRYVIKPIQPVIQLQAHHFFYSTSDKRFYPMVMSRESVTWGIQFSYPQLYQDRTTQQIIKVAEFPNTSLFAKLMRWMRSHTLPAPFLAQGEWTCATIRIGKSCLQWINNHPQLREKGIQCALKS